MTDLRKAAEMALEVLENEARVNPFGVTDRLLEAIEPLRVALDKHKTRMARDKKRVKPRVPPWMVQP
jgi:hypothetical protein